MFFEHKEENLTLEEKVEFLYEKAKKDEKRRKRKIYYRIMIVLLIIGYFYYFYMIFIPKIKDFIPFDILSWWSEKGGIMNVIDGLKNIDVSKIEQMKELIGEMWTWELIQIEEVGEDITREEILKKYLNK